MIVEVLEGFGTYSIVILLNLRKNIKCTTEYRRKDTIRRSRIRGRSKGYVPGTVHPTGVIFFNQMARYEILIVSTRSRILPTGVILN